MKFLPIKLLSSFCAFIFLPLGCANVAQIDRGTLSQKMMSLETFGEEKYFLNQARSYRESSTGGLSGPVGGGCGCN